MEEAYRTQPRYSASDEPAKEVCQMQPGHSAADEPAKEARRTQPGQMKERYGVQSNYELTKQKAAQEFLQYNQSEMIRKFDLEYDADYLYLNFVGRPYRINRKTGLIQWRESGFIDAGDRKDWAENGSCGEEKAKSGLAEELTGAGERKDCAEKESCGEEKAKSGLAEEFIGADERFGIREADYEEALTIYDVLCQSKEGCRPSGRFCKLTSVKGPVRANAPGMELFAPSARYFEHRMAELELACQRLGGLREKVGDVSYRIPVFDFLSLILQFWDGDDEFPPSLQLMWDENILDYMRFETTFYVASHVLFRLRELMGELPSRRR